LDAPHDCFEFHGLPLSKSPQVFPRSVLTFL
jgi:hypothetical protein